MATAKQQPLYKEGPFKITRRIDRNSLQISGTVDGKRYRFLGGPDLREAKRRLANFIVEIESGWRPGEQKDDSWKAVARRVWGRHKNAAKIRNLPFLITAADVYLLIKQAEFRCSVSGIAFSRGEKMGPRGLADPWAPSLDRIDNRVGYVADNVRIVCVAANVAMNNWGYDTLLRLAKAIVRNAETAIPEPPAVTHAHDTDFGPKPLMN